MLKSIGSLACAALAWPVLGWGQAAPVMSWEDCVSLALRNNPDLSSSQLAKEAGQASYYGSFNGLFPQLNLSNSYSNSGGGAGGKGSGSWQAQAAASVDIFNASQIAGIKTSAASLSQAKASLRLASTNVRFNLRQAFLQLLFSQENLELTRRIKDLRAESAKLVALRYDGGTESKGNMLQAQAEATQADTDYELALLDMRTAQKALDRQLGLEDFRLLAATGTLTSGNPPEPPKADESLLARRPDIARQQAVVDGFMAGLSQAESSLWPSLSANYSRSRTDNSEFPSAQYGWTFGGVLSYPFFGGGPTATYYGISAAKRNLERAKEDLRSARYQAIVDLDSSWAGFARAVAQVKVQAALLAATRQRNDEADIRYASGLMSYDNWEIIASGRISQEHASLAARLNSVNAEAAWDQSLGRGLGE